ncbi:MAG TPA: hypothetical protein VFP65_04885 [Anaeromyxobacteraceae bacterium]|nr:hypothetical protein [Anaeromyxobacteraceae bacterium]
MSASDGEPGASGRIERELGSLRNEIADLVGELDRRRREAFDVRLQLRRHPAAAALAGVALAAVLGGAVALLVYNGRRKQRRSYKARQLKVAMGRVMKHPERVARGEPPPGEKILAAVGTALATLLVKRAFERAVPSPRAQRQQRQREQPSPPTNPAHA